MCELVEAALTSDPSGEWGSWVGFESDRDPLSQLRGWICWGVGFSLR